MVIIITNDISINSEDADKILKLAYLKGYFDKCEDVTNGCDIHKYIPEKEIIEFHIKDPMFWVELSINQVMTCLKELEHKEKHHLLKKERYAKYNYSI